MEDVVLDEKIDYLYISHEHEDHFDKKFLSKFDKNVKIISERLLNYYGYMKGVQLKSDDAGATIIKIINSIIFDKDPDKEQNLNPSTDIVLEQMRKQGYTDNDTIWFSALAYYPEKVVTQHLLKRIKDVPYTTTRVGVALYKSGSVSHERYWWIKNAKVMIDKIGEYIELHEGSKALARFNLVGVYQNHIGSIDLFKLGTIVSIEEIKACYEDLQKQGKFN